MAAPTYSTRDAWSIASTAISLPFDTTGAVGPDSVLSVSNQGVDCYTKEGTQLWTATLKEFFGVAGTSPFDPRIVYDSVEELFYVIAVQGKQAGEQSDLLIAVSDNAAPAVDGWTVLTEEVSQGGIHFLDYPLIGFNADVVTIMGVAFLKATDIAQHYMVYVIPKSNLTDGSPSIDNLETLEIPGTPNKFFTHPVLDLDNGSGEHTLWAFNNFQSRLERYGVELDGGSYAFTDIVNIPYANVVGPQNVEQPAGDGDDLPLNNHAYRRVSTLPVRVAGYDYLVLSSTGDDDLATIVVIKIDISANTITAKTILAEDGLSLIYPSIAVNSSGHIVVGCTSVGPGVGDFASAMIFVGQDDGATMTFAAGEIVQTGTRYYENTSIEYSRWGDYSATVVDPLSPTRFWTFQSWAWNNEFNNAGRSMEVTEVITTPSGVFDLFGLTMGWWSTGEAVITSDKIFKLKAGQSYLDGAIQGQTYLDGTEETDTYLDGAVQAQAGC